MPPDKPDPELQAELQKRRQHRRAVLRKSSKPRLTSTHQWIFVVLALLMAGAWLLLGDRCTKRLTQTYGTLTDEPGSQPRPDGSMGARPRPRRAQPPLRPRTDDDGW